VDVPHIEGNHLKNLGVVCDCFFFFFCSYFSHLISLGKQDKFPNNWYKSFLVRVRAIAGEKRNIEIEKSSTAQIFGIERCD
jgi:hypothetical protein